MPTATHERLTSPTITLHYPLDYCFGVFLRAKEAEGLKPRALNDHQPLPATLAGRAVPDAIAGATDRRPRLAVRRIHREEHVSQLLGAPTSGSILDNDGVDNGSAWRLRRRGCGAEAGRD